MSELIVQKHDFGCGAACVAQISGKSYDQVISLLDNGKVNSQGFLCKELVCILGINEYSYGYIKPRYKKRIYADGIIVFIKRSKRYPSGHYLLRHKGQWMDPWVNFCQTKDIKQAKAGYRSRLPGKPIFYIYSL